MLKSPLRPWQPDPNKIASGKPGAVQGAAPYISPNSAMSWRLPGRPSSISSTLHVPPSARVSTSCNTKPIHDPPAGNGPASHIAPSAHPQSLDTPLNIGLTFPHKDGKGFNIVLQALPLDGKIVCREITNEEGEDASQSRNRQEGARNGQKGRRR